MFKNFAATIGGKDPAQISNLATGMAMFINNFQIELMGDATIGGTETF